MTDPSRMVFLSYRRSVSWQLAAAVQRELGACGFDVFVDTKDLGNGLFDEVILAEVARRQHLVVILQPGSLDRIGEQGDWLGREIAHALALGRNIVPLVADTTMPRAEDLPPSTADLSRRTAVTVHPEYFREAMDKLVDRLGGRGLDAPVLSADHDKARGLLVPVVPLRWTAVPGAHEYVVHRGRGVLGLGREVYRGPARRAGVEATRFGVVRARVRAECHDGLPGPWSNQVDLAGEWGFSWPDE